MSHRKETTRKLSEMLEAYLNPSNDPRIYTAKEVTFDFSTDHPVRVDYMKFSPVNNSTSGIEKGDFYCYEIKSCMDDFKSKNGHNFLGDYNYYVMPLELAQAVVWEDAAPYYVGILSPIDGRLEVIKSVRRQNRTRPISEMLLMMFRSANRELMKLR